jgi:hypothetical protein
MAREAADLGIERLARDLLPPERARIARDLSARLAWLRALGAWPRLLAMPEALGATPIVAVYAGGALLGCSMAKERGKGGERLARAFLGAAFAGWAKAPEGAKLAAEVAYARRARFVEDAASIEVGTEGVAWIRPGGGAVLLLPQVARDHRVDGEGFLAMLRAKAGAEVPGERLAAWTVERVVGRTDDTEAASARAAQHEGAGPEDYAAAWLARLVGPGGEVAFAIDPRARVLQPRGELYHARSAVAIEALAAHGGHGAAVARARRWLSREIARALGGARVEGFPEDVAAVSGTLALAHLAGVDLRAPLLRFAERVELRAAPWHAAQVALALGRDAPDALWAACVADLGPRPFAPWTVMAARARGDMGALREAAAKLSGCLRARRPHAGGAAVTRVPETALTAVAAHALLGLPGHRADARRALDFVRARQLLPGRIPAALDPALALGGFSASPVLDLLRGDITGHALLALLADR